MLKTALLTLTTAAAIANATPAAPVYNLTGDYNIIVNVGVCYSNNGDGAVVYATDGEIDPNFDYIAYDTAAAGDVVLTVEVMTAGTIDDVVFRDDYIIESLEAEELQSFIIENYSQKSADAQQWMMNRLQ